MSRKRKHKAPASSSGEKEVAVSGLVSRMRKLFGSKPSSVASECGGVAEARADSPTIGRESSLPEPSGESEASSSVKSETDAAETPLPEPSAEGSDSMQDKAVLHRISTHRTEDTSDVVVTSIRIPRDIAIRMKFYCVFQDISNSKLITSLLEEYLASHPIAGVPMETIVRKMNKSNKNKK